MFADLHSALTSGEMAGRVAAMAEIGVARCGPRPAVPRYLAALRAALAEEMPPFCTDLYAETYRAALASKAWTARSLIGTAQREGDRARRLRALAARADEDEERKVLARQAVDQSNHARGFLALLDLAFPGAVDAQFRAQLETLCPGYTEHDDVTEAAAGEAADPPGLDDFVEINLEQLRSTSLQVLLRPALLEACPPDRVAPLTGAMDALLGDEMTHVVETAAVIERRTGPEPLHRLAEYMAQRLRGFIDLTSEEPIDRGYHLRFGHYP